MKFQAKKAVRTKRPLKVSVEGLSGSGKTFTALRLAFDMRRHGIGSKIVVMDSENGSASLYAGVEIDGERRVRSDQWDLMLRIDGRRYVCRVDDRGRVLSVNPA